MTEAVQLLPVLPFPMVEPGDDLAELISAALKGAELSLLPGDALVVAQKIVSKAEGRYRRLSEVKVSSQAMTLASEADKEPALAQLILDESSEVLRARPGVGPWSAIGRVLPSFPESCERLQILRRPLPGR